ncbi:hypothetical protein ASPCADRAFT_131584 [Aspergillus carbonarius ITEM 5010]|uniref:F-box domain-containing protein n=1 Tax=Aspergillus carbonarius (strain ITEM 5010) TaxID=602072 RepID=A0A1R3RKL6_ASPC5|nr:hypothetical protein ASPCADRAFT_131584 [Aspergillus carbonarius ITEM 5010]
MATSNRCYLSGLPAELISHVFTFLPTLTDVLNLAATCSRHQQIWQQNAHPIYRHVGPGSIECLHYARIFLADQGGAQPNAELTARDVVQLARNAAAAERTVDLFNQKYVSFLLTPEATRGRTLCYLIEHPGPQLTPSECHRFIRALYQLSGLLLLDPDARQSRVASLTLKDITTIIDLAHGYRDIQDVIMTVQTDAVSLSDIAFQLLRIKLRIVREVLGAPMSTRSAPKEFGWMGSVSIWDMHYDLFKDLVTQPGAEDVIVPISEVWYDTSDEEDMN